MNRRGLLGLIAGAPLGGVASAAAASSGAPLTPNQMREKLGLPPISDRCTNAGKVFADLYVKTKWQHRVMNLDFIEALDGGLAAVINSETADGSELVCTSEAHGRCRLVLRRLVPDEGVS